MWWRIFLLVCHLLLKNSYRPCQKLIFNFFHSIHVPFKCKCDWTWSLCPGLIHNNFLLLNCNNWQSERGGRTIHRRADFFSPTTRVRKWLDTRRMKNFTSNFGGGGGVINFFFLGLKHGLGIIGILEVISSAVEE